MQCWAGMHDDADSISESRLRPLFTARMRKNYALLFATSCMLENRSKITPLTLHGIEIGYWG